MGTPQASSCLPRQSLSCHHNWMLVLLSIAFGAFKKASCSYRLVAFVEPSIESINRRPHYLAHISQLWSAQDSNSGALRSPLRTRRKSSVHWLPELAQASPRRGSAMAVPGAMVVKCFVPTQQKHSLGPLGLGCSFLSQGMYVWY